MTTNEISELLEHFAEAQRLSDLDALSELLTADFELVDPLRRAVPKDRWRRIAVVPSWQPGRREVVARGRQLDLPLPASTPSVEMSQIG